MHQQSHLKVLDAVRGVAILLVVIPHLSLAGGIPGGAIVQRMIQGLGHGVDIFFVLSGFCLASPILKELRAGRLSSLHLPTFYVNRIFRIVPMFLIATALCALVSALYVHSGRDLPATLALPTSWWGALAPLLFLDRGVEPINANFWSIAVQIRWYAIFPFLLALYVYSRRFFCVAIIGTWVAYLGTRLHTIDLGTISLFMLGIVAADLYVTAHPWRRFALWGLPLAMLLGHIGDRWATMPDVHGVEIRWTMQPTTLGWQLAAFCFIIAATENPILGRVLSMKPLVALGIASFSVYLIHTPVMEAWLALFGTGSGLGAFAVSVVAGAFLWFALERPLTHPALRRAIRAASVPAIERALSAIGLTAEVRYSVAVPVLAVPAAQPLPAPHEATAHQAETVSSSF